MKKTNDKRFNNNDSIIIRRDSIFDWINNV